LAEAYVGNETIEDDLVDGMVRGMSGRAGKLSRQKLGGQQVAVASPRGATVVAWYREGVIAVFVGLSRSSALSYVTAYAEA
jgi:hypothetical protein